MKNYNIAWYNIGALSNNFTGVYTYLNLFFPFLDECKKQNIDFTWLGEEVSNDIPNKVTENLIAANIIKRPQILTANITRKAVGNDVIKPENYDALFLQCRPAENKIEVLTVETLLEKFTDKQKPCFLYEQDIFKICDRWKNSPHVVHLRPYLKADDSWKNSKEFLFWHSQAYEKDLSYKGNKRPFDFTFIGNMYGRQESFKRFFEDFDIKNNAIFGNWVANEEKKKFSSAFNTLNFHGVTNHNLTAPLLNASFSTLQILPPWAEPLGLYTYRVFAAVEAETLCFCDSNIYGCERFFPKELIVKDGKELSKRIKYLKSNESEYLRIMKERDILMEPHSVENRVNQFRGYLEELVK